jgi:hypothetical protein
MVGQVPVRKPEHATGIAADRVDPASSSIKIAQVRSPAFRRLAFGPQSFNAKRTLRREQTGRQAE